MGCTPLEGCHAELEASGSGRGAGNIASWFSGNNDSSGNLLQSPGCGSRSFNQRSSFPPLRKTKHAPLFNKICRMTKCYMAPEAYLPGSQAASGEVSQALLQQQQWWYHNYGATAAATRAHAGANTPLFRRQQPPTTQPQAQPQPQPQTQHQHQQQRHHKRCIQGPHNAYFEDILSRLSDRSDIFSCGVSIWTLLRAALIIPKEAHPSLVWDFCASAVNKQNVNLWGHAGIGLSEIEWQEGRVPLPRVGDTFIRGGCQQVTFENIDNFFLYLSYPPQSQDNYQSRMCLREFVKRIQDMVALHAKDRLSASECRAQLASISIRYSRLGQDLHRLRAAAGND